MLQTNQADDPENEDIDDEDKYKKGNRRAMTVALAQEARERAKRLPRWGYVVDRRNIAAVLWQADTGKHSPEVSAPAPAKPITVMSNRKKVSTLRSRKAGAKSSRARQGRPRSSVITKPKKGASHPKTHKHVKTQKNPVPPVRRDVSKADKTPAAGAPSGVERMSPRSAHMRSASDSMCFVPDLMIDPEVVIEPQTQSPRHRSVSISPRNCNNDGVAEEESDRGSKSSFGKGGTRIARLRSSRTKCAVPGTPPSLRRLRALKERLRPSSMSPARIRAVAMKSHNMRSGPRRRQFSEGDIDPNVSAFSGEDDTGGNRAFGHDNSASNTESPAASGALFKNLDAKDGRSKRSDFVSIIASLKAHKHPTTTSGSTDKNLGNPGDERTNDSTSWIEAFRKALEPEEVRKCIAAMLLPLGVRHQLWGCAKLQRHTCGERWIYKWPTQDSRLTRPRKGPRPSLLAGAESEELAGVNSGPDGAELVAPIDDKMSSEEEEDSRKSMQPVVVVAEMPHPAGWYGVVRRINSVCNMLELC